MIRANHALGICSLSSLSTCTSSFTCITSRRDASLSTKAAKLCQIATGHFGCHRGLTNDEENTDGKDEVRFCEQTCTLRVLASFRDNIYSILVITTSSSRRCPSNSQHSASSSTNVLITWRITLLFPSITSLADLNSLIEPPPEALSLLLLRPGSQAALSLARQATPQKAQRLAMGIIRQPTQAWC